jgi:hypothetical protein
MAFQINGNTVVDNNRKGTFLSANPGVYTNATRPSSPSTGDLIYNSDANSLQVWDGSVWKNAGGIQLTTATGGTIESYNAPDGKKYTIHIFTSPGNFEVTNLASPELGAFADIDVITVGGGGGGGRDGAGGGGGGAVKLTTFNPANPLPAPLLPATIPVTIGAGGAGGLANPGQGTPGEETSFGILIPAGGGGGGGSLNKADPTSRTSNAGSPAPEGSGGGGGGGFRQSSPGGTGGSFQPYGNPGGSGAYSYDSAFSGGGGGGVSSSGTTALVPTGGSGGFGVGIADLPSTVGTPGPSPERRYFGGGGGGGGWSVGGTGGVGGGGNGGRATNTTPVPVNLGLIEGGDANTGGGGGGSSWGLPTAINPGGSGIAIVRYRRID